MARLLWAHGNYDDAERYCRISEETGTADDVVSEILWRGTKAKLLALGGDGAGASALADSAVALAERTDFLLLHAYALGDRAEAASLHGGDARADRAAAEELLARKGIHVRSPDATPTASASASTAD
jgi:ATP/maltotriose-dependent transcriptional regulator MalT